MTMTPFRSMLGLAQPLRQSKKPSGSWMNSDGFRSTWDCERLDRCVLRQLSASGYDAGLLFDGNVLFGRIQHFFGVKRQKIGCDSHLIGQSLTPSGNVFGLFD